MKIGRFAGAIVISSCFGLTVDAQQPQPPVAGGQARTVNPTQSGSQPNNTKVNDEMLAHCLIVDNQAEIALARMAEGKTKNEEVKKLASMLQKDHRAFVQKLQTYSPNTRDNTLESNINASGQDSSSGNSANPNERTSLKPVAPTTTTQNTTQSNQKPGSTQGINSQTQQGPGNATPQGVGGMNLNQLHQELAQQCLSDAQAKLSKENGAEFDKCFVGMQIAMHAGMLSKLTVFERHASNELKQVITEGKESTQKHMETIESVMKQLIDESEESDDDESASKKASSKEKESATNKNK